MPYNLDDARKRQFAEDTRQEGAEHRPVVKGRDNVHRAGAPVAPVKKARGKTDAELIAWLKEEGIWYLVCGDDPFKREGFDEELGEALSASGRPRVDGEGPPWSEASDIAWLAVRNGASAEDVIDIVRSNWSNMGWSGKVPTKKTVRNRLRDHGVKLPGKPDAWDGVQEGGLDDRVEYVGTGSDLEDRIYGEDEI